MDEVFGTHWPATIYVIGDRLDITGARRGLERVEAVLTLRALLDDGDFDAYWAINAEQERFRVHHGCHQDGYGLIA